MWSIAKKDLKILFYSPIGYIVVSIFLLIFGVAIYIQAVTNHSIDFNTAYSTVVWYGMPIIVAVLTMKSFSEEKSKDNENLLFVNKKNIFSVVGGKILAVFIVILISILISLIDCFVLLQYGNINFGVLMTSIFGFLLLSLAYISFGVLISSLTESQVISAIITLVFLFLPIFFSFGQGFFSYLSLVDFYTSFSIGVISLQSIFVYISFTAACVILAILEIDRKRKLN